MSIDCKVYMKVTVAHSEIGFTVRKGLSWVQIGLVSSFVYFGFNLISSSLSYFIFKYSGIQICGFRTMSIFYNL